MSPSSSQAVPHRRAGVVLLWLCAGSTLVAAVTAATGGFTYYLAGLRISMHTVTRPVVVAVAFGALGVWALGLTRAREEIDRASLSLARHGWLIACVFAVVIGVASFTQGAQIAGGADSSGYLSEARLWRDTRLWNLGALHIPTPLARELTLTNRQYPFTAVGFQPSSEPGFAVPGYPPGLPMLLALAGAVNERAQFAVVPLCAGGLVILAFLIGRRLAGPEAAVIAAAATGASPILLYQATQPMSDVPAAFWWTLAALGLIADRSMVLSGIAASMACAIRPNMFVMVPVAVLLAWWRSGFSRHTLLRLALFVMPVAVTAVAYAWLQQFLYGSASTSGYGELSSLFAADHIWPNLTRYPQWAIFTQSGLLLAAVAAPIAIRRGWVTPEMDPKRAERMAWSGLILFACLQGFYLLYIPFDDWVYFRFLLPALPWLLALQATALSALCRRVRPATRGLAVILLAILVASWGVGRARGLGAFRLQISEQRYLDVAEFTRGLPPNAVFVTLQHSGSLPYYGQPSILRWDWIEPGEIDRALMQLSQNGHNVFAVLDEFEEPQFRTRFAGTRTVQALGAPLFAAGGPPGITARVYAIRGALSIAAGAPVSWQWPPAPRSPHTPAAPVPALDPASSPRR